MEIPFARWYGAIRTRRSRRQFNGLPVAPDAWARLEKACADFRPFQNARAVLVEDSPSRLFKGIVGPYGKIRGAPSFVAFVGNMNSASVQEEVGYTGEGIILEAEALQLDTCWVGGFFRHEVAASSVDIGAAERIIAVTPVGYASERPSVEERLMTGFGLTHRRKALRSMVRGLREDDWPDWVKVALYAARIAPSAVNRQPWVFNVEHDSITVSVNRPGMELSVAKRLDCGISMLHIEVAALCHGVRGTWDFLKAPQVARFNVTN